MCVPTSTATVTTKTPIKPNSTTDEAFAQMNEANALAFKNNPGGRSLTNSLEAPTLTDQMLVKARKSAYLKLNSGGGRKASFTSGPVGDLSAPKLKGY